MTVGVEGVGEGRRGGLVLREGRREVGEEQVSAVGVGREGLVVDRGVGVVVSAAEVEARRGVVGEVTDLVVGVKSSLVRVRVSGASAASLHVS